VRFEVKGMCVKSCPFLGRERDKGAKKQSEKKQSSEKKQKKRRERQVTRETTRVFLFFYLFSHTGQVSQASRHC
jgi:hypothetical protein